MSIVDLRSDTITRPNGAMRAAMASAEVGDDVFRDDPTIHELERRMAELTGKEAALFVPSGTMGNLICVMSHCWGRGQEMLLGDKSHIHVYEQGGCAQLAGVHPRTLANRDDGTFSLEELEAKVRGDDPHLPVTRMVAIENTHNKCGGVALPLEWLEDLGKTCRRLGLILHCDGARIWNASACLNTPLSTLLQWCDSASICLSKGLGCPVGSVIVGSRELVTRAIRVRKVLGGGWRQAGVLAAAGVWALDNMVDRVREDHEHAAMMAATVTRVGVGRLVVRRVDTNIVVVWVDPELATPDEVLARLEARADDSDTCVKGIGWTAKEMRLTFHCDISRDLAQKACDKMEFVIKSFLC